jgi:large subunit ribosomal protein L32
MGVPQHRRSKSNVRSRRAQQKIEAPSFGNCPQCHAPKEPHKICAECGFYKGKEVIAKAE